MKKRLTSQFLRSASGASIVLATMLSTATYTDAKSGSRRGDGEPFSKIYAFGDSLCDTGNFFEMSGQPGAPYFEGRFSNGPVWIEYLAAELGMRPDDVVNYAVGGATTGRENNRDVPDYVEFPGLQDQLDYFENDLGGKSADRRGLYIVWAGANDFFVSEEGPAQTIATAIGNTLIAVQRLHQAGARRIMVINLPDLGLTPYGRLAGQSVELSYLSNLYNQSLELALTHLAASGIETSRLDSAGLIQDMVAEPANFELANATDPFLRVGGDPSGFLFWDDLHPSTLGHYHIAKEAMMVLRRDFRHAWATPRNAQKQQGRR